MVLKVYVSIMWSCCTFDSGPSVFTDVFFPKHKGYVRYSLLYRALTFDYNQ